LASSGVRRMNLYTVPWWALVPVLSTTFMMPLAVTFERFPMRFLSATAGHQRPAGRGLIAGVAGPPNWFERVQPPLRSNPSPD
jgi:hypothetical protein